MIDRDEVLKMAKDAGIDLVDGEIYGSTNGAVFALVRLIESRVIERVATAVENLSEDYYASDIPSFIRALNDGASGPNPPTGTVTK